ncbi:MAG TPA: glycerol-3-phosphate 1-O-acyltransferase PlsY [Rhizomicrobium sp.]|jgi:glycerol-3-phosphate acyltransferase PlsY|nr:glycerol-3-phosphate 1-O-acyltransferase PlsY [Rhizomicrobium sp.]
MMLDQFFPGSLGDAPRVAAALAFGYFLGSVPFGLIFGWFAGAGDVRSIGSGNIGATNVLRTGKRWAAAATLICDAGKGALAVIAARSYGGELSMFAGVGAFCGHVFPVWLKFKGGKGVATFLGVMIALDWRVGLLAVAAWIVAALLFRISSLSALIAAAPTPIFFALFREPLFAIVAAPLALLIFFTHRGNIARLTRGEEPRIGQKSSVPRQ